MAFPLSPVPGQNHTEAGLRYVWTGTSWDLLDRANNNQILITSTVDPVNGVDTADHIGAIWRNTTTGDAFRYETIPGPSPFTVDLRSAATSTTGHLDYPRQSVTFTGSTTLTTVGFQTNVISGAAFDIKLKIFAGEASGSNNTDGETLFGAAPLFTSATQTVTANPTNTITDFTFAVNQTLPAGTYSLLFEHDNFTAGGPTYTNVRLANNDPYSGGFFLLSSYDLAFSMSGTLATDGQEWNPVRESPDFQVTTGAPPTVSSLGSTLKEGDLWVNSIEGRIYYRSAVNTWLPLNAFYDNTVVNALTSTYTVGAINEIDAIFDGVVNNGSRFIGTYAPSTNTADFVASTGYADGTLPAANTLTAPDFLVVTEQAVGQAPAPTVQMYKGDFLLADPGTNTWIHYQFGAPPLSYLLLGDTPSSYATFGQQLIRVNATETGMEFAPAVPDTQSNYGAATPGTFIDSDIWVDSTDRLEYVASGGVWDYTAPVAVTSSTPPANPFNGALWWDRVALTMYIYDTSVIPASWVAI